MVIGSNWFEKAVVSFILLRLFGFQYLQILLQLCSSLPLTLLGNIRDGGAQVVDCLLQMALKGKIFRKLIMALRIARI